MAKRAVERINVPRFIDVKVSRLRRIFERSSNLSAKWIKSSSSREPASTEPTVMSAAAADEGTQHVGAAAPAVSVVAKFCQNPLLGERVAFNCPRLGKTTMRNSALPNLDAKSPDTKFAAKVLQPKDKTNARSRLICPERKFDLIFRK